MEEASLDDRLWLIHPESEGAFIGVREDINMEVMEVGPAIKGTKEELFSYYVNPEFIFRNWTIEEEGTMKDTHGALHIKHRPQTLDEVVGNRTLVKSLQGILKRKPNDRPRAYLLHGPSGCGKTTFARILATELGAKGMDFSEIDVADYNGVDTIRTLRERIQLKPMESEVRAYILDEAHMLTKPGQTALLKSLEDTPAHVCFFLCTTDPNKLLPTVRNRCLQMHVESLNSDDLNSLMRGVAKREGKRVAKDARERIISLAKGSPRLALTMLDSIIDLSKQEQADSVKAIVDKEEEIINLCRTLMNKNSQWKQVRAILAELYKTEEPEAVRRVILAYFTKVILGNGDGKAYAVLDAFREPTYDNGWACIAMAAWEVCHDVNGVEPF